MFLHHCFNWKHPKSVILGAGNKGLKWGNCEDCGNTGVDPVCVLVCHYCHVKCSSVLRNLRENSTPLQLFLVASTLIINIDFSGYLQKGIAYLSFQSNILSFVTMFCRLAECTLTEKSCGIVATVLQSPNSLTELDLSNNVLRDSGVQLLSNGLSSPHCKLQTLRLVLCMFIVISVRPTVKKW